MCSALATSSYSTGASCGSGSSLIERNGSDIATRRKSQSWAMCRTEIRAARGIPEGIAGSVLVDAAIAAIRAGLWLGQKVDVGLRVVPPGGVRVVLGVEHSASASAAGSDCSGPPASPSCLCIHPPASSAAIRPQSRRASSATMKAARTGLSGLVGVETDPDRRRRHRSDACQVLAGQ